jgi:hypothetical protein
MRRRKSNREFICRVLRVIAVSSDWAETMAALLERIEPIGEKKEQKNGEQFGKKLESTKQRTIVVWLRPGNQTATLVFHTNHWVTGTSRTTMHYFRCL